MNTTTTPAANNSNVVTIDAIFIAQQFERINVTLEFMKDSAEKQAIKEDAQDKTISQLVSDMAEVKSDVRSIKDAKAPRIHPVTWLSGAVGAAAFVLVILNQLYGA